jgi:hypothetical protein
MIHKRDTECMRASERVENLSERQLREAPEEETRDRILKNCVCVSIMKMYIIDSMCERMSE